jgi:hypothetical protein
VATAFLVLLQVGHLVDVLRYDDTASFPGVLGDPVAIFGIGIVTVAIVLLAIHHRLAPLVTAAAGAAIAVGFVLTHAIPVKLGGLNNPYWTLDGGNEADLIRWVSVVALVALGGWTTWAAWRSVGSASPPTIRSGTVAEDSGPTGTIR